MRPHRLRMTAFGPFADTVEVDLDALAASGLFLLQGETGAGKTTLLDGLGFALYGRVPGARGRTGRLRSDHASPAVRTEVQLEVSLGGRRWRITRSPAQERPKSRGTGTTTEQAKVLLEVQRDGGWSTASTRLDEAAQELDPLLGMSADQFFQVVLLPQGEFARFLRAESKERGQLLQRLFATERFQAVEDWLAGRRVATAGVLAAAGQDLRVLVARLAQSAAVEPPDEEPVREWVERVVGGAERERAGAQAEAAQRTGARDLARAAAAAAVRVADRQERRRAALRTQAALSELQPAHEQLAGELRAAERAGALAPTLRESGHRRAAAETAALAETAARQALRQVGLDADLGLPAVRSALAAARTRSGRLAGLRATADELAAERAELVRVEAAAGQHAATAARLAAERDRLPARRERLAAELAQARAAADRLPEERAAAERLAVALDEARGLVETEQQRSELRSEHLLAREGLVGLREKEAELRESRLTSMVAELAGQLQEGAPCEVCGSVQHPDPYEGDSDGVSKEDEDRARLASEAAARTVAEVEARLAAATAVADGQRARLAAAGLGDDVRTLSAALAAAQQALAVTGAAARALPAALQQADDLDAQQAAIGTELTRAQAAAAAAGERQVEAAARAARLEQRLAAELEGAPDLESALQACSALAARCEAVVGAAEQAGRDEAEADRAEAAAALAASEAGFASPEQARAALRRPEWHAATTAQQAEHERRVAAVEAALRDPELDPALDPALDRPAGVEETAAALGAADAALAAAVGALAAADARCRELAPLAPRVLAGAEALAPLEEQAALAKRLADLCAGSGGNALRMTLTSFVLAARLEEVAAAATGRLLRMTQGRYALVHTDGAARGGVRSGLGLLVRDGWTGRERETSTLSGGETFLASLALALGLADVVQAEAGGTRIEALFVDEGFGTLDEQALDEVMDVLDGLREGGRLVGLVSHVPELRARIPAQVQVRKTRVGSTVHVSVA